MGPNTMPVSTATAMTILSSIRRRASLKTQNAQAIQRTTRKKTNIIVMNCQVGDLKKSSTDWNGLLLSLVVVVFAATMVQKGTLPPQESPVDDAGGASTRWRPFT